MFGQIDSSAFSSSSKDSLDDVQQAVLFSSSGAELESDLNEQDASAFLQASKDVFTQFASFQFSAFRYRNRGYGAKHQSVLFNGINMTDPETGIGSRELWGGLNDMVRFTENGINTSACRLAFSGIGGFSNIDSKASVFKKGSRFSFAQSNRQFAQRTMFSYARGVNKRGWSMALCVSNRFGENIYVKGKSIFANALYFSIDKNIHDKQQLGFVAFLSSTEQGRVSAETQEAYATSKDNFYNSSWGYQNGKLRNANMSALNRPVLMLTHLLKFKKTSRLNTALCYTFGKKAMSGLNWNNAANPRPDYYRYLPAFYEKAGDSITARQIREAWNSDINARQLNWNKLIAMNQNNLFVLPQELGLGINTQDSRARYILEDKIEDVKCLRFNTLLNTRLKSTFFSAGLQGMWYQNQKYKQLKDLLGATYWLDYDQFAQNIGADVSTQQNNIEHPDKKIKENDLFGYNYLINIREAEAWLQAEYSLRKIEAYAAGAFNIKDIWRTGLVANGKFPNNSKGNSEQVLRMNPSFKSGITFKLNGRHAIVMNAAYLTRCADISRLFISPRSRNDLVSNTGNEEIMTADISYHAKFPAFKCRLSLYATQINNQTWLSTYWHDEYNTNVNLMMKHVNQQYQGLELGLEKNIRTAHVLQTAIGLTHSIYSNRPVLEAWQDNTAMPLYTNRTVYIKNYRVGAFPQTVMGITYRYNAKKHWFVSCQVNFVDGHYLEPNPDRRTKEALTKYLENEDEVYQSIIRQERLPAYYTFGFSCGKSFRLKAKQNLSVLFIANNLSAQQNTIVSGFEQLRWDAADISKFANKYVYLQCNSYFIQLSYTL
ncbi:MAG: hypothetical protein WCR21_07210 [Bacteroidota bacterium]